MGFELLKPNEIKSILSELRDRLVLLHKKRIQNQKQVDGSSFPHLRLKTIIKKQGMGSSVSNNAFQRLVRTGDFLRHAFLGLVKDNSLEIFINDQPYKAQKIQEARERALTRVKQGKRVSKKAWGKLQHSNFTYRDLAGWQLSKRSPFSKGSFPKKGISNHNEGADFFGLSKKESDESFRYLERKAAGVVRKNIESELSKIITNARNK